MAGDAQKSGIMGLFGGKQRGAALFAGGPDHLLNLLRDFESSGQGWFWSSNAEGLLTHLSEGLAQRHGKRRDELVGQPMRNLFLLERDADEQVERTLPLILNSRKTFSDLMVRAALDGDEVWWAISGRPQYDAGGNFTGFFGNGVDVTERRRAERSSAKLAEYDSLTGLSNRHRMGQRLNATLNAYKVAKRSCAIMMIDLDRFKQVNDTLGHPAGDELLKQVSQRIGRVIDKSFDVGRLGGDEFQILLPDIDDRGRLGEIAKTVIAIVSQPYTIEGSRCVIGASLGIAVAPYDGITSDELIRNADLALYAAKAGGRGQFRFYSSDLHDAAERRRQVEEELRDALAKDQIYLGYQPLVESGTGKVLGFEALMRWNHPELGSISPSQFIPIAEETNMIVGLGEWALRQACNDAAQWDGNLRVAVNVSPSQFVSPAFPGLVASALAASQLDPCLLELELTESIFLGDSEATDQAFAALKKLGVRLSLDDFGTGYSSLAYLKKAPFDKIKIDQGFIRDVTQPGNRNRAIISAIVSLASALDMDTTAEGIEALDELKVMEELGVKQIQGFVYSYALPQDEVIDRLATGEWIIEPSGPSHQRSERRTMLRKIGVIHEDHRYDVTMRNISRSGAMIEGMLDVPIGTEFVLDMGDGQLAVGRVRRSRGDVQGLEFEAPLVDDGAGGLCTRNRVSPYHLAAAGMPLAALPQGQYSIAMLGLGDGGSRSGLSLPKFGTSNPSVKGNKAA